MTAISTKYFKVFLYYFVCIHVGPCATYVFGACEGQKKASDPLEVELQTAVSGYVGVRHRIWVLWKRAASVLKQ